MRILIYTGNHSPAKIKSMKCVVGALCAAMLGLCFPVVAQKSYYVVVGAFSTEGDGKSIRSMVPLNQQDTLYSIPEDDVQRVYILRTENAREALTFTREISERFAQTLETSAAGTSASSSGVIPPTVLPPPRGKYFQFVVVNPNGDPVNEVVHLVDFPQELHLASFEERAIEDVVLPAHVIRPSLICQVFGYKTEERVFVYDEPSFIPGAWQNEKGVWVVPYRLRDLQRGDVSMMDKVSFLPESAVLTPESEPQLNQLVDIMTRNPKYRIRIHTHCNGKARSALRVGTSERDVFDPEESRSLHVSAWKRTRYQGEAIQNFLISRGIDPKRVTLQPWGGSMMLVDAQGPDAHFNNRVEIEILED